MENKENSVSMGQVIALVQSMPASAAGGAIAAQHAAEAAQAAAEQVLEDIPADYSELSQDVAELKSAFGNLIDLEPIETIEYFPLQMGACFGSGVSIDNMTASTKIATVPKRIDASLVMTIHWDDDIYQVGLVPLNNDGTGKNQYYWFNNSPYTTSAAPQGTLYRTFMVRRKDGAVMGDVDLDRILYEIHSDSNPIVAVKSEIENDLSAAITESEKKANLDFWQGFVRYNFPNDFNWADNPIADKVSTDGKGRFRVDYNVMDHISTDGVDVYVATNGSDSNDGLTAETPKKTIGSAIGVTNARRVHIAGGYYPREEITLTADIDLLGDPNNRAVFTGQNANTVWSPTAVTGVYTTDHKNYGKVYDLTDVSSGTYRQYTEAQDVAAVQATQGTYYDDGTTMTIHTYGNAEPTLDKVCYAQGWSALRVLLKGHTAIAAHLCFTCSGTYSSRGQLMFVGDDTDRGAFMLYNCDSSYSIRPAGDNTSGGSAINPANADGIIQYCTAYHAGNDGFSYGAGCKIVEIGCASAYNGTDDITSCNGSTAHGGSYIRINGAYHDTHGPIVHDVGATESVNLGLAAWHSTCEGKPNFCASGGAVKMWLDSCVGYSSDAGIDVGKDGEPAANAIIYKRNCTSDVADGIYGGQIIRY